MGAVILRRATPADAAAVAAVHVGSWQAAYRGLLPDAVLDGLSTERRARIWSESLAGEHPAARTVLAVGDPGVVGFVSAGPSRDDAAVGELYVLYVAPSTWGAGVGRRLHAAALRHLGSSGVGRAVLWVLDGNERAARFYRRAGWSGTGRSKDEPGPGGVVLREHEMALAGRSITRVPEGA